MTLIERLAKLYRIIVAERIIVTERITIKLQRELDRYIRNQKIIEQLKKISGIA